MYIYITTHIYSAPKFTNSSSDSDATNSDPRNRLVLLNNLGQIYRQLGWYEKSLRIFQETVDISHIQYSQLQSISTYETYVWSIMYLYTIQGIASYWGDKYEYTEVELQRFVSHTDNDTIDIGLDKPSQTSQTSQTAPSSSSSSLYGISSRSMEDKMSRVSAPVSTMKLPCLDPYTYSLTHFSSLASDLYVCQSCCTALPDHSFSHQQRQQEEEVGEYSKGGDEEGRVLKVGYIR